MQHIKSKAKTTTTSSIDGSTTNRVIFKEETPDEVKTKRKKIFWWVVGGVVVVSAIGLIINHYMKNKKSLELLSEGGSLLNVNNSPIPSPSTVPVQTAIQTPNHNISASSQVRVPVSTPIMQTNLAPRI